MSAIYRVRRPDGKCATECTTREHAEREIAWRLASEHDGPFTVEERDKEPDWPRWGESAPNRYTGPWPAAKIRDFIELYGRGEAVKDIADFFDTSVVVVCAKARQFGFGHRIDNPETFEKHRGRWTEREERLINFMYDETENVERIAESMSRTGKAITSRLRDTARVYSERSARGRFKNPGRRRKAGGGALA